MIHGSRHSYGHGCRCQPCVDAMRAWWRRAARCRYRPAKVSPAPVRRHLLRLRDAGLGGRTIADAGGVSPNRVYEILRGSRNRIWRRTAERILSVTADSIADGALVDARPTLRLLSLARAEGYSFADIARVLNIAPVTARNLVYRQRVTARTAFRVRRAVQRLGVTSM